MCFPGFGASDKASRAQNYRIQPKWVKKVSEWVRRLEHKIHRIIITNLTKKLNDKKKSLETLCQVTKKNTD